MPDPYAMPRRKCLLCRHNVKLDYKVTFYMYKCHLFYVSRELMKFISKFKTYPSVLNNKIMKNLNPALYHSK